MGHSDASVSKDCFHYLIRKLENGSFSTPLTYDDLEKTCLACMGLSRNDYVSVVSPCLENLMFERATFRSQALFWKRQLFIRFVETCCRCRVYCKLFSLWNLFFLLWNDFFFLRILVWPTLCPYRVPPLHYTQQGINNTYTMCSSRQQCTV